MDDFTALVIGSFGERKERGEEGGRERGEGIPLEEGKLRGEARGIERLEGVCIRGEGRGGGANEGGELEIGTEDGENEAEGRDSLVLIEMAEEGARAAEGESDISTIGLFALLERKIRHIR